MIKWINNTYYNYTHDITVSAENIFLKITHLKLLTAIWIRSVNWSLANLKKFLVLIFSISTWKFQNIDKTDFYINRTISSYLDPVIFNYNFCISVLVNHDCDLVIGEDVKHAAPLLSRQSMADACVVHTWK